MSVQVSETTIRPAAVVPVAAAAKILRALEERDVATGGVWNATPGVWQRYDRPWDGPRGSRGNAQLLGTVAVVYDRPRRHEITVYKATLTEAGLALGWTTDGLCDDALGYAELTLASCPRDELTIPPERDPFHDEDEPEPATAELPRPRTLAEILNTDVRELLRTKR